MTLDECISGIFSLIFCIFIILCLIFIIWCFIIGSFTAYTFVLPEKTVKPQQVRNQEVVCEYTKGWFAVPDYFNSNNCFTK